MPDTRARTLTYRRAVWGEGNHNLQRLLTTAVAAKPTVQDRTFVYQDGQIYGLEIVPRGGSLYGHVAAYIPGQPTSIVPVPSRAETVNAEQHPAPARFNFSEGDLFFLLRGNHLLLCPSGVREGACISFIRQMLAESGHEGLVPFLHLDPVADVDGIGLLNVEGVKKVTLGATLFEATTEYQQRHTLKQTVFAAAAEEILAFFAKDRNFRGIDPKAYENLSVKLELSFDGRKVVTEAVTHQLERTATDLLQHADEDEGFVIETREGKKLTHDSIRVNRPVALPIYGNSVSKASAYDALRAFYTELHDTGALAQ